MIGWCLFEVKHATLRAQMPSLLYKQSSDLCQGARADPLAPGHFVIPPHASVDSRELKHTLGGLTQHELCVNGVG